MMFCWVPEIPGAWKPGLVTLKGILQSIVFNIMTSFFILDLMKLASKEKILVLYSFLYAMLLAWNILSLPPG